MTTTYAPIILNAGMNMPIFTPVAKAFSHALKQIGRYGMDRKIAFGVVMVPELFPLPQDAIIYNLEVIGGGLDHTGYLNRMRNHEVWDYSIQNVERLRALGIEAKHVPLGYSDTYRSLDVQGPRDIDVLFYGSMNERRRRVLEVLSAKGLKVIPLFDVFGAELQHYIHRAKIVLDVAYYAQSPVNQVRLAPLWSDGKFALSETPAGGVEHFSNMLVHCPYEELADEAAFLLRHPLHRRHFAEYAHDKFRTMRQEDYLAAVV